MTEEEEVATPDGGYDVIEAEGEADVLAITACPSGVAHTFLAAKSLQKAAAKQGIKIKVETQGANGIINRTADWSFAFENNNLVGAGVYTGTMRLFCTTVFTSVSTDQATTSERGLSGANGLSGLCTPAPWPCGSGDGVPAGAEAAGDPNGDDRACAKTAVAPHKDTVIKERER